MPSHHIPNYLRAHRKRAALSQGEVSFLLGAQSGAKVSRHEQFIREPSLEAILAYEIIFQKPLTALFGGPYRKIEREIKGRVRVLLHRVEREKDGPRKKRRLRMLRAILNEKEVVAQK